MNERGIGDRHDAKKTSQLEIRARLQLDEICSSYESGWTHESIIEVEELAREVDSGYQSKLVCELLAIDFEMRQRSNCELSHEDFVAQLPAFSDETNVVIQVWMEETKTELPKADARVSEPTQIGDYRIVKLIGRGGTGAVYEAVQESLDRPVAIKTLSHPHIASQLARFKQEARAVAMLHHTNIVAVYGSGTDDTVPYFAMQLIDGMALDQLIEKSIHTWNNSTEVADDFLHGTHGQQNIARIGLEVARALGHAHQQGILHRDIKPSNLLVDRKDNTWVSDFGLAKLRNEASSNTLVGSVVGTMRYVPPEAFSGDWSERGDIYSLGATLYELLALKPAFVAEDHPQLIKQITLESGQVTPLRQINPTISKDLEIIVTKAMSFDPNNRFSSADEMANELDRYLNGLPIKSRPIPASEKLFRWSKRKPTAAALALLICAVAFIGLPIATWLWLNASSALGVAEAQRENATRMQIEAEDSRLDAEAAGYSSQILLASNYIDDGRASDARRILDDLKNSQASTPADRKTFSDQWELDFLNQQLDTSRLTLQGDENLSVWHVAIRPDEKQIATVHAGNPETSQHAGEVILWSSQTGERENVLTDQGSRVFGCVYSNDGKTLATIGFNLNSIVGKRQISRDSYSRGSISLWDVETGNRINKVELDGEYPDSFLDGQGSPVLPGVLFSDDDQQLICWPNPVEVRDTKTLERLWEFNGRYGMVGPGNRVLVYTGTALHERDLKTGEEFKMVGRQWQNFGHFGFSSDRKILSCKAQDRFRIYDSVDSLEKHQDIAIPGIYWAAISPDATEFTYSARKGEVRIQPTSQSDPRASRSLLGHQSTVTSGAYSKDGSWLVTGSVDGTAKVWDLATHRLKLNTKLMHAQVASICFTNEGDEIAYCARKTNNPNLPNNAGTLGVNGNLVSKTKLETTYCAAWPRGDFSFSRDGKIFASPVSEPERPEDIRGYANGGVVGVWDTDTWKLIHTIETQLSEVVVTAWSADKRILAVAGTIDGVDKVRFYSVEGTTIKPIGDIEPATKKLRSMAFHESKQLAVGSSEEILIWKLSLNELDETDSPSLKFGEPKRIPVSGESVSLDFSPDGVRLASADFTNDKLKVFEVDSGELCYERTGPRRFCCVRFSPCGKRLALSGYDSIVHLCDAEFGFPVLTLVGCDASPGTFSINSKVVFSPDGRRIATNNWRGKIAFWEIEESKD